MLIDGTSHAVYQLDNDFVEFGKHIQQAIVSIHNYELNSYPQHLVNIKDFTNLLSKLRHRLKNQGDVSSLKDNQINFGNIDDAKTALILCELLCKISCNSNLKSLRQNKDVNELLVSIYKTLGLLIHKRQDVCTMLWYFSQKLFSITWWNNILNRLHAKFVLVCVSRLGVDKTTLYSVNLFAKACKSIGKILTDELKKELSNDQNNESLKKLLDLIEQIGTECEGKINFNFPNTRNIFNYLNSIDVDSAINRFSNQIMMRKTEAQEQNQQNWHDKREEVKEKQTDQNDDELNNFCSETQNQKKKNTLNNNENELQKQNYKDLMLDEFCLTLTKLEIVEAFEVLLKSVPKDMDENEIRFHPVVLFITNFINKAIKYVTEREQNYQNMRQYQCIMNMLLLIVKSKELMRNEDIKRMFNSEKAINSWFDIILKEHDFNFISKHMKCMVYQILTEILIVDLNFTRNKIMLWTYNIGKIDQLINRMTITIQYFTNSIIGKNKEFNLNHHEADKFSDYYEIHSFMKFLRTLCDNCKEFQDYLRIQHNRIKSTSIILSIVTLIRVCLNFVEHQFALKICIDAFEMIYALVNKMNKDNKDYLISIRIYEFVKQVMELGWFSANNYYPINKDEKGISNVPVFNSNKLILELKQKALEVSNQVIDDTNRHEFLNSIGKEVLDENLKIGYAQLLYLNKGVMHRKYFNKDDKACENFNIKMLFECYYLRAKISDKDEVEELNIIQSYDNESTFDEIWRVANLSLFNLFRNKLYDFNFKVYEKIF